MCIIIPQANYSTFLPPRTVFSAEGFIALVYWPKDRKKSSVHYLKRKCPDCGYIFEPIDHNNRCIKCCLGNIGFQEHLALKRDVDSWKLRRCC